MIVWANVTDIAPELASVDVTLQLAALATVERFVSDEAMEDLADTARAYLAAHLATVSSRKGAAGPIVSASVGSVSVGYGASIAEGAARLGSTAYGLTYEMLVSSVLNTRLPVVG
jgi:hypothetical protein